MLSVAICYSFVKKKTDIESCACTLLLEVGMGVTLKNEWLLVRHYCLLHSLKTSMCRYIYSCGEAEEKCCFIEGVRETLGRFDSELVLVSNYFRVAGCMDYLCKGNSSMKEHRKDLQTPQTYIP